MEIEECSIFQASWNETNQHLQTPESTTTTKVKQVFWNVMSVAIPFLGLARYCSYKIGQMANRMTLPAAHFISKNHLERAKENFNRLWLGPITDQNRLIREHYSMEPHTIKTPDGAELKATLFRHNRAIQTTPTVIYFCANFQLSIETPTWPLEKAIETDSVYNFVIFDYRGVGESTGTFSCARDLIVDGSSIVEWVEKYVQTPPDQIHFMDSL